MPSDVVLRPSVAQRAVLARASVSVTHCGMNSAHEALVAGVPMFAFPQSGDQFLMASRLLALGGAQRLSPPSSSGIRDRITAMLVDAPTAAHARRLGTGLRPSGGAVLVVDRIERLIPQ